MSTQRLIILDPGHGGPEAPGAVNEIVGVMEKDIVLKIGLMVMDLLWEDGHDIAMTRYNDVDVSLSERTDRANAIGAFIFVSIHCNSVVDSEETTGIETFNYPLSENGNRLATAIQESLIRFFPDHKNRGVKEGNFQVLRDTNMPAALVEMEFLSNDDMAYWLTIEDTQQKIALAIAEGIESYLSEQVEIIE